MNKSGLRKKLLLSHIGVALTSLLTITLLVYLVMTFAFGQYMKNQQQAEADTLLKDLAASYNAEAGGWTMGSLMQISHQAMLRNYTVKIYDDRNKLIWDTSNMGMMPGGTDTGYESGGNDNIISTSIMKNGQKIGRLEIQGIESAFASQNQQFLRLFNSLLWGALLLVIVGVSLFSVFMANSLSRPLMRIKQIATRMRTGDLSSRVALASPRTEIDEVGLALNHLADALEQQDKLRKNLTADIAHELRTPLATIQSHIEAFQDGVWQATPDKLEVCHEQVMRLVKLIHDLEKLTAVENPMLQLQKNMVSLNEVIRESVKTVSGQFEDKKISIDIQQDQEVFLTGDYVRLVQVFVNLLNNAYKYTNEGNIRVVISEEPAYAKVTISDTGTGIGQEELPFIFERFYRGEKSRNRKTGGAGIGLAIVKAIVEAHGGHIAVQSAVGQGSQFSVRLPKSDRSTF
ncbi:HAMP domain-containing histidine kinase [Paenibacillus melissococcoides]|uniref:histidine kinase n=1 Tax=Paenibacillus melissococcoides TaxID=2912268 RepID=A0ABN8U0J0_9BACL|nr:MULTISPECIES: HAMP domain-containing sensor histidine kinase [Paenibacillus]MEB9898001.1 HAMP domain-containing sensor histidine kinase [Bacillus cereus]CAH8244430.1 HAMP domain-containing histidine kinase [Paenibacillus melissococcoides]CAH8703226.1 HAMP domain-containing histidine kinase [Paenibacillus melissococcoides]CAH8705546.1 HAMP domain-containing histidine kinase [Paenibacillus melissococcoides]CAH8721880.1 HAMP domain-containing histidine kinase [Paenibacillus melissococcoides]